jgi:hypothetical protein
MSRQLRLLFTLGVTGHGDDHIELLGLHGLPRAAFQGIPIPVGAGDRMIPNQEEQVRHGLLERVRISGRPP